MDIITTDTYEDMSLMAADIILDELRNNPDLLLCAATGRSPQRTYRHLAEEYKRCVTLFDRLRVIKLDEWAGVPMEASGTLPTTRPASSSPC